MDIGKYISRRDPLREPHMVRTIGTSPPYDGNVSGNSAVAHLGEFGIANWAASETSPFATVPGLHFYPYQAG